LIAARGRISSPDDDKIGHQPAMTVRELLRRWSQDGERSRAYLKGRRFTNGFGALSDEAIPCAQAAPLHRDSRRPTKDRRSRRPVPASR
jgi:hypothetical protein